MLGPLAPPFARERPCMTDKHVLFINGSVRGEHGNTAELVSRARTLLPPGTSASELVLTSYQGTIEAVAERMRRADALVFASGVYWGNWGSPLQRFLEVLTAYEVSAVFMGKPVAVLATMDSVGGSDMTQRLLGVLSNFGCLVPPLCSLVLSRVGAQAGGHHADADVWKLGDVRNILHNLLAATEARALPWQVWPVAPTGTTHGPYRADGPLHGGLPHFIADRES